MIDTYRNSRIPKVSIGMPVFNGERFLCEAVESLLSQTFKDFELLISDNASTDRTKEICETYAAKDSRIRYVRQTVNLGMVNNFRWVLDNSFGEYFMWAAHDDIWAPNWIEVLLPCLHPGVFSVRGAIRFIRDGKPTIERTPQFYARNSFLRYFIQEETTMNARHFYIYGIFRRHELLEMKWSVLEEKYCPDFLFVFQMLRKGSLHTEVGTHQCYRMHANNSGTQMTASTLGASRLLYKVHPLNYYRVYVLLAPGLLKILICLLIPYKHLHNQTHLWWRGFRAKILRRENI